MITMLRIAFIHSLIRPEEKMLIQEFHKHDDVDLVLLDDRALNIDITRNTFDYDLVFERCINHSRALHLLKIFNDNGIRTVNSYKTAEICGSKFYTTTALVRHHIPTPQTCIAFTPKAALDAMNTMGYPVVLKPTVGSWGRLISKVNDRDAAEALLEHKELLGSYHHSIYYIQQYVDKALGRDIRSFVVGGECIAAIYRTAEHWKTNTAKGAVTSNCPITDTIRELSLKAAVAVKGEIVAIDIFEHDNGSFSVNEVNYTMEFRNSISVTGVNIPEKIVSYAMKAAKAAQQNGEIGVLVH
jgi:[lysine-biosynthesis-protein LysW]---L-2-aminoadipate ligase